MSGGRAWFVAGGALAVVSLGLPWAGQLSGAAHPARVAVVAALALAAVGLRTGRDLWLTAALVAGVVGVLVGGFDATPGRIAFTGAVACLVLGCRAGARRLVPGRAVRPPAS